MSELEAHPVTDLLDDEQPGLEANVEVEEDYVTEPVPADAHTSPEAQSDVPRASIMEDVPPVAITDAPIVSQLPPKVPGSQVHSKQAEAQAACLQYSRVPSSGRFRTKTGVTRPRTFTARPPEGCTRHISRPDYTHNEARLVDIARETRSLVTRLESIYSRHVTSAIARQSPPRGKPCNEAPAQRNRRVFSQKIAAENLRIYNRLQAVKPSKDTTASQLRRDWETAQKYSHNCSTSAARRGKTRSPARRRHPGSASVAQSFTAVEMSEGEPEVSPALHVTVPSTVHECTADAEASGAEAESHPIDLAA